MSRLLRQARCAPRPPASAASCVRRARGRASGRSGRATAQRRGAPTPLTAEQERPRVEADAYAAGYAEGRAHRRAGVRRRARRARPARRSRWRCCGPSRPTRWPCCSPRRSTGWSARSSARSRSTPTLLLARAEAAAALIGEDVEPSRLRVHPDDIALLERAALDDRDRRPIRRSTRGAIVLETGHGWIEDGPRCASSGCAPSSTGWRAPQ